ncbi:hypothetical protein BGL_1c13180 [Burkholderia plantarii]|uniref:Uncharacterized protein n=1 Tax=Burkholderia plantarii TaxID=41899 RepID=A0A0B6RR67_BURPL|nr:hypothetical protein BGL_1c13180 [Burkholderia plantarii]
MLVETTHGVTPWRLRAVLMKIRTSIKTGNPTSWQGPTVRSSLNFYILYIEIVSTRFCRIFQSHDLIRLPISDSLCRIRPRMVRFSKARQASLNLSPGLFSPMGDAAPCIRKVVHERNSLGRKESCLAPSILAGDCY